MNRRTAELIGWATATTAALAAVASVVLTLPRLGPGRENFGDVGPLLVFAVGFAVVGALVVSSDPTSRLGWVWVAGGAAGTAAMVAWPIAQIGLVTRPHSIPAAAAAGWVSSWAWILCLPMLVTLGLLLYPDGALPSPRWRWFAVLTVVVLTGSVLATMLNKGPLLNHPVRDNPVGLWSEPGWVRDLPGPGLPILFGGAVLSLVLRWRRGAPGSLERRRVALLAIAALLSALVVVLVTAMGSTSVLAGVVLTLTSGMLPLAAGYAVLQERLHLVDAALWRAVTYMAMFVGLSVVFAVAVRAGDRWSSAGSSVLPAVLVALTAVPAHQLSAKAANRLLYGSADNPYAVVSALSASLQSRVEPSEALDEVAAQIAAAVTVPYVAIEVEGRVRGSSGTATGATTEGFPLVHAGIPVGLLRAEGRGGRPPGQRDRELLAELARTAAPTVRAASLAADLAQAQRQAVTAREEERRRLRRDLHDGVGPALAGIGLGVDLARRKVDDDPATAVRLMAEIRTEVTGTIGVVRRLVEGLRPAALDDLGLVGALQSHASGLSARAPALEVRVDAVDVPALPAAVETSAYLIAVEAMTNVVRHAHARHCTVSVSVDDWLEVRVADDGQGIDGATAGTGLRAMRERAESVGGTLTVESAPGTGSTITATLPLEAA